MNIWMLTHGDHDEYGVTALFDDEHKDEADKAAELTEGSVEGPLVLNHFDLEEPPPGLKYIHVEMFHNGDTGSIWEDVPLSSEGKVQRPHYSVQKEGVLKKDGGEGRWRLYASAYTKDKKHAVKIVNEIRTRIITGALPERGDI